MILGVSYVIMFAQINNRVIYNSEVWRLFTAMFLHADIMHIFSNLIALVIFGTAVEENYTKTQFIIIYLVSGFLGNIFSLILLPITSISLGASGAIFGLMGAAFIIYMREDPTFLFLGLIYIIFFLVSSLGPGINLWAHLFGLVGGLLIGYLIKGRVKESEYDRY